MEHFEDLAIRTATKQPSLWLRYVDDTFVIWRHGQIGLEDFLSHLNSIRNSIQFTMEVAGELPFLDVLVKRNDEEFHTSIFRKPTHTDSYINYWSNHHPATKIATILCLKKRATKNLQTTQCQSSSQSPHNSTLPLNKGENSNSPKPADCSCLPNPLRVRGHIHRRNLQDLG